MYFTSKSIKVDSSLFSIINVFPKLCIPMQTIECVNSNFVNPIINKSCLLIKEKSVKNKHFQIINIMTLRYYEHRDIIGIMQTVE